MPSRVIVSAVMAGVGARAPCCARSGVGAPPAPSAAPPPAEAGACAADAVAADEDAPSPPDDADAPLGTARSGRSGARLETDAFHLSSGGRIPRNQMAVGWQSAGSRLAVGWQSDGSRMAIRWQSRAAISGRQRHSLLETDAPEAVVLEAAGDDERGGLAGVLLELLAEPIGHVSRELAHLARGNQRQSAVIRCNQM